MFKDWIASRDGGDSDGLFGNLIAEEGPFDRSTLWRLGSWGVVALLALTVAILLNQSSVAGRRQAFASTADLTRQTERIQWVSDNAQAESRRLTAATQTLQNDRDRLYARVTSVEQTLAALQSLTIAPVASNEQKPSSKPDAGSTDTAAAKIADNSQDKTQDQTQNTAVATGTKPVAAMAPTKPAQPQVGDGSAMSTALQSTPPPTVKTANQAADPIVTGSIDTAAPTPAASAESTESTVEQTKFGIDLGAASSMQALRVLWGTMLKSNAALLGSFRPIMVMKEGRNGLGLQLHLVAGPLTDAAAATQLCAALAIRNYSCDTAVFDGQRLSMDNVQAETDRPAPPPAIAKPKKEARRRVIVAQPQVQQPAPSAFARIMGR